MIDNLPLVCVSQDNHCIKESHTIQNYQRGEDDLDSHAEPGGHPSHLIHLARLRYELLIPVSCFCSYKFLALSPFVCPWRQSSNLCSDIRVRLRVITFN